jgi:hypothetical protein
MAHFTYFNIKIEKTINQGKYDKIFQFQFTKFFILKFVVFGLYWKCIQREGTKERRERERDKRIKEEFLGLIVSDNIYPTNHKLKFQFCNICFPST